MFYMLILHLDYRSSNSGSHAWYHRFYMSMNSRPCRPGFCMKFVGFFDVKRPLRPFENFLRSHVRRCSSRLHSD
jgi:hypothetical protein